MSLAEGECASSARRVPTGPKRRDTLCQPRCQRASGLWPRGSTSFQLRVGWKEQSRPRGEHAARVALHLPAAPPLPSPQPHLAVVFDEEHRHAVVPRQESNHQPPGARALRACGRQTAAGAAYGCCCTAAAARPVRTRCAASAAVHRASRRMLTVRMLGCVASAASTKNRMVRARNRTESARCSTRVCSQNPIVRKPYKMNWRAGEWGADLSAGRRWAALQGRSLRPGHRQAARPGSAAGRAQSSRACAAHRHLVDLGRLGPPLHPHADALDRKRQPEARVAQEGIEGKDVLAAVLGQAHNQLALRRCGGSS